MTEYDKTARLDELQAKNEADLTEDEATELAALVDELSPPTDDKATPRRGKSSTDEPTRYCAYDLTHERFIGAVTTDKAEARNVIKHSAYAKSHKFEIREV